MDAWKVSLHHLSPDDFLRGNICSIAGIDSLDGDMPSRNACVERAASPTWLGEKKPKRRKWKMRQGKVTVLL